MRTKLTASLCFLLLGLGVARAQNVTVIGDSTSQASAAGPAPQAVQPPTPAPDLRPPAPPQKPPAPPVEGQAQALLGHRAQKTGCQAAQQLFTLFTAHVRIAGAEQL